MCRKFPACSEAAVLQLDSSWQREDDSSRTCSTTTTGKKSLCFSFISRDGSNVQRLTHLTSTHSLQAPTSRPDNTHPFSSSPNRINPVDAERDGIRAALSLTPRSKQCLLWWFWSYHMILISTLSLFVHYKRMFNGNPHSKHWVNVRKVEAWKLQSLCRGRFLSFCFQSKRITWHWNRKALKTF